MKNNKVLFLIMIIAALIFPTSVFAGGGDDDRYELPVPSFEVKYVKEDTQYYTCIYRMNMSDVSPVMEGSFDFTINFDKKGGDTSIVVNQASEIADWTDLDISRLVAVNSISKKVKIELL